MKTTFKKINNTLYSVRYGKNRIGRIILSGGTIVRYFPYYIIPDKTALIEELTENGFVVSENFEICLDDLKK